MIDWDEIVERDGQAVWRVCWRVLGNRADADEAFQDAFVAAYDLSRRQTLNSPRAVLLHLATARSIDRLRARQRQRKRHEPVAGDQLEQSPDSEVTPRQHAEAGELADELRLSLAMLPPRQAEVFTLHAVEGWAYQEIADQLGLSVDNVGVLIHRARAKLKKSLARFAADAEAKSLEAKALEAKSLEA